MTRAARVYDFTMPAFGAAVILAEGSFYRLMSATGAVEVRRNNGSIVGPLLPGQGERAEFISLTITDKSGAANAGTILIADDQFIDERISGEVSVIDGGVARTMSGRAFMGNINCQAVAGQYSHGQLWNPAGSNVRVVVSGLLFAVASAWNLKPSTAAIATLGPSAPNKRAGGAIGVAELRIENNVSALGGASTYTEWQPITPNYFQFDEPFVLDPGNGLLIGHPAVNLAIRATFEYFEVAA